MLWFASSLLRTGAPAPHRLHYQGSPVAHNPDILLTNKTPKSQAPPSRQVPNIRKHRTLCDESTERHLDIFWTLEATNCTQLRKTRQQSIFLTSIDFLQPQPYSKTTSLYPGLHSCHDAARCVVGVDGAPGPHSLWPWIILSHLHRESRREPQGPPPHRQQADGLVSSGVLLSGWHHRLAAMSWFLPLWPCRRQRKGQRRRLVNPLRRYHTHLSPLG